ncbi:hypothetical protein L6452_22415 [Arctium lappa]|uniref:Uncharacterized protein n=1 Tax=Arctium lappa TaxID=4217 RepID=A0ACB9B0H8_ARCLA|nr:hypothetical protein L6452_22415 [Arctium lappa]
MMLFLEGVDPTIPEYVANGPYETFTIIVVVLATPTTPVVPERYAIKEIRQWSDEDKKKVGLDGKAKISTIGIRAESNKVSFDTIKRKRRLKV